MHRANIVIFDESNIMDYEVIDNVITPFLTLTNRGQLWATKEKWAKYAIAEHNSKIFMTSIGGVEERSYRDFVSYLKNFCKGMDNYVSVCFPYYYGVEAGIIARSLMVAESRKEGVDIKSFRQEYEAIPLSDNESSVFTYTQMVRRRKLEVPLIPPTDSEYIACRGRIDKLPTYTPLIAGEERIISMDIATAGGKANDNSIITVFRIYKTIGEEDDVPYYIKEVSYMEALNGVNIDKQIVRLKQLFYDLECSYAVIDAGGAGGIMAVNLCGNVTNDTVRNKKYPGWRTCNLVERFDMRVTDPNAEPVLYCKIVSGAGASNEHLTMITQARLDFDRGYIHLLDIEDRVIDKLNDLYGYIKLKTSPDHLDKEKAEAMLTSVVNTTEFIKECTSIQLKKLPSGKYVIDAGSGRKDRFSSFIYGLNFIHLLEKDLMVTKQMFSIEDYFTTSGAYTHNTPSSNSGFSGKFNGWRW